MTVSHSDSAAGTPGGTGNDDADLVVELYAELRSLAASHLRGHRAGGTLTPTALVHEAYLKLEPDQQAKRSGRAQVLGLASLAMRRVLVDHARARNAAKRGGGLSVTLDESIASPGKAVIDMLVLDRALDRLAAAEPRWAQVVELRYFTGLEIAEVAGVLGVSSATVKRDWQFARAWLARELGAGG